MFIVEWTSGARRDIADLADYISLDNPTAADRVTDVLLEAAEGLRTHPERYRLGRLPGTRELVALPSYILVYRIDPGVVHILSVLHTSQQYPPA